MSGSNRYTSVLAELDRSPRTWLVTGAAGFIGSHLSQQLLDQGHEVLCADNFFTGSRGNIGRLMDNRNRAWIAPLLAGAEAAARDGRGIVAGFGALHLPGRNGVLALLAQQGFTVTPLGADPAY